ncbi:MAG TPA: hypothetical protein VN944_11395 [Nitrospiria bacterium]|nr:hypothetical protein [Nitrospiria bacterium]
MIKITGAVVFFLGVTCIFSAVRGFAEPKTGADLRFKTMVEGPATVKQVCGRCHAIKINGQCFAGDCEDESKVRTSGGRDWVLMVGWMRNLFHCAMTDDQGRLIADYFNLVAPKPKFPVAWKEAASFQGGFNVPAMKTFGKALFAGIEGNPVIYRTEDGRGWKEVMKTSGGSDVFTIEEFNGALYAGVEGHQAELWRSKDGVHWKKIHTFPYEEMPYARETGVTALGVFKGFLYAGTYHLRLYRSSNGLDWEEAGSLRSADPSVSSIKVRFLREFKGYLYAGSTYAGKLYRSLDGSVWEELNALEEKGVKGLTRALVFNDQLYVGTRVNGTIWRSAEGQQWEKIFDLEKQTGKTGGMIGSMAVYHGMLYAGGTVSFANAGVYRSRDGQAWEPAGSFSPFDAEAMSVFQNQLYVATIYPRAPKVFQMVEK